MTPIEIISPRQLRSWVDAGVIPINVYVDEMRRRQALVDAPEKRPNNAPPRDAASIREEW